jgi:hypothetical protein
MQRQGTAARIEQGSLAPIQLERTSVDEEVALMKRGKGLRLTVTLLVSLVAIAGGARLLSNMDTTRAYASGADRLDAIDAQQSEAFLRCALPNLQRAQVASASALFSAIEFATERFDKQYGKQLAQCAPLLGELQHALDGVRAPSDMTLRVQSVRVSAQELGQAWNAYRVYLQDPNKRYDYVQATPMIEKISEAWETYRGQLDSTKAALRSHQ